MSPVDWYLEGVEFSNCHCDYACPCQFESRRPTYGDCRGFAAVRIDKGHFGDVALDGLGAALLYAWPGPIYEGNGECQAIIDERADGQQRDALATVLYGGETNEGATHWWVYRMMSSTVHPPLFKDIEFDVNIERRTARLVMPGCWSPRPVRSEVLRRELSIASASTSRMGSSSSSRRSAVVPRGRWLQSPSTSRTPTIISPICASRARGWFGHDKIRPLSDSGLTVPRRKLPGQPSIVVVEDRRTSRCTGQGLAWLAPAGERWH
jgi:hypothetical protein